jgi:hypothetical protein
MWDHTDSLQLVQTVGDRLFILDRDGMYEYSTGPGKESISDRQVFTALARLYLEKHELGTALEYAGKAAELDPNYPALALVRAHIYEPQKKTELAGIELAQYANLVGVDSKDGKQALAELTSAHQLQWQTAIDTNVAGAPLLIENRIVSVGRRTSDQLHLVALDANTGAIAWRWEASRFVASVAGTEGGKPVLWYASGDAKDYTAISMYRIDIRSGEREPILQWKKSTRIDQAWIAAAAGRLFVASASANPSLRTVDVDIDAVDVANHRILWPKTVKLVNATSQELNQPVTVFAANTDALTYAVGSQRATLLATTGVPSNTAVNVDTQPSYKIANDTIAQVIDLKKGTILAKHSILWRPFQFRIETGTLYAFTLDGRAYSLKP